MDGIVVVLKKAEDAASVTAQREGVVVAHVNLQAEELVGRASHDEGARRAVALEGLEAKPVSGAHREDVRERVGEHVVQPVAEREQYLVRYTPQARRRAPTTWGRLWLRAAQGWVYWEIFVILAGGVAAVPLFFSAVDFGFGR